MALLDRVVSHLGPGPLFFVVAAFGKCVRVHTHLPQHLQLQHGRLDVIVTAGLTVMLFCHCSLLHTVHIPLCCCLSRFSDHPLYFRYL